MKRISILTQTVVITLIISACAAPQAAPTVDPVVLQSTAVVAASTILAETQAALPTATLTATATDTPVPTNTFVPLPTLEADVTPSPVGNVNVDDPCITNLLPDILTGQTIKIRIDNPTKGTINLSVNLHPGNPQNACGYRAYVLGPQDSLVINDLVEGCYSLWAWNPEPKDYFMVTNGTSCLDSSRNWTFDIVPNGSINLKE